MVATPAHSFARTYQSRNVTLLLLKLRQRAKGNASEIDGLQSKFIAAYSFISDLKKVDR